MACGLTEEICELTAIKHGCKNSFVISAYGSDSKLFAIDEYMSRSNGCPKKGLWVSTATLLDPKSDLELNSRSSRSAGGS